MPCHGDRMLLHPQQQVINGATIAQILTPLQEARGHMAAAPLSFSPWYVARYLDRSRAGWESLLLHEEWSREPRSLEDLDVLLLGNDPLMVAV